MNYNILSTPNFIPSEDIIIIGEHQQIQKYNFLDSTDLSSKISSKLRRLKGGLNGSSMTTLTENGFVSVIVLPDKNSRHNTPAKSWSIPDLLKKCPISRQTTIICLATTETYLAISIAIGKRFPIYSKKTTSTKNKEPINIFLYYPHAELIETNYETINICIDSVRKCAEMCDAPPNEFHIPQFLERARNISQLPNVTLTTLDAIELQKQDFGGLYHVGKAGIHPPHLVHLQYKPPLPIDIVAIVGKGIIYDTGGLSLKSKVGMPGMKGDMAGAAAVLCAFEACVRLQIPVEISAILCLAENSIGPLALRNDDIITMKSGRTVEVNNTDAEGRLVLADGVFFAAKTVQPRLIIDCATLTGASAVSVGKKMAAMMSNCGETEEYAIQRSRYIGDVVFPIPYAPELHKNEFYSTVADMKNSVKDRSNAQASCAGQFIANHLPDAGPKWLHIDMSGPSKSQGRATGFGTALLISILHKNLT
jgi:probable aminopeptidase NPEPL1